MIGEDKRKNRAKEARSLPENPYESDINHDDKCLDLVPNFYFEVYFSRTFSSVCIFFCQDSCCS